MLAAIGLLFFAGFVAAGNWQGAKRYVWMWCRIVGSMFAIAVVLAFIVGSIVTPSP